MMNKRAIAVIVVIICVLFVWGAAGDDEAENGGEERSAVSHKLTAMFSFRAATITITLWDRARSIVNTVQAYLYPPNLDFRRSNEGREKEEGEAGEKVKEAVGESLRKSKATVEDSAKGAAKVATERLHKTKEKVSGGRDGNEL
ncbi:uncharacterized protein LOC8259966 [Ricinus communis]|uniref:Uncharacterized protein n=1 Tax=Ricinus communis TaxID=3988 RepID=B9RHV6_RICCO|nr:uncharacterized protein LOC8259966 [Ricinus communis]EEF48728.1 conserved hypothetical protein [Ricinus communis]|eukprot:XP_002513325.1 uncharacterized protein LOC8259966 [Ricinus communis]